jgi:hypothetical protein
MSFKKLAAVPAVELKNAREVQNDTVEVHVSGWWGGEGAASGRKLWERRRERRGQPQRRRPLQRWEMVMKDKKMEVFV